MPRTKEGGPVFTIQGGTIAPIGSKQPDFPVTGSFGSKTGDQTAVGYGYPTVDPNTGGLAAQQRVLPDGTTITTMPDGTVLTWSPENGGTLTTDTLNPDGSTTTSKSDGQGNDVPPNTDYESFLGMFGLPPDVQKRVTQIFQNTPDVNQATTIALGYVRGTDWYKKTYPGIQEGIAKGLFADEPGYRAYLNKASGLYQQFYNRPISSDEFAALVTKGIDLPTLQQTLQSGNEFTDISSQPGASLFTPDELHQIAANNSGLGSQNGGYLAGLLKFANSVAPIYKQYGAGFDRNLIETNYKNGVAPDTIGKQLQGGAFIKANEPDIQQVSGNLGDGLLDTGQLKAYGEEQAGLDTPLGQTVSTAIDKAQRRLQSLVSGRLAVFQPGALQSKRPDVGA